MLDNRRHMRIRELLDIDWSLPSENVNGKGQILNISSSGMLLQTDKSFKPKDDNIIAIDAQFLTKTGKVVWFRNIQSPRFGYLCGVEFFKDQGTDKELEQWLEDKTAKMAQVMDVGILNNYMN